MGIENRTFWDLPGPQVIALGQGQSWLVEGFGPFKRIQQYADLK